MELKITHLNKSFKVTTKEKQRKLPKRNHNAKYAQILKNLDLLVQNQDMYCLLGNNGAGKSTLLNCIGGILIPDSGSIVMKTNVNQINLVKEPRLAKKHILFNFQDPKFDTRLSAKANLDFHLRMFMIERETRKKLISEYLNLFNLYSKRDSKVYFLSGGHKKHLQNILGLYT